jgi:hypothetical protein
VPAAEAAGSADSCCCGSCSGSGGGGGGGDDDGVEAQLAEIGRRNCEGDGREEGVDLFSRNGPPAACSCGGAAPVGSASVGEACPCGCGRILGGWPGPCCTCGTLPQDEGAVVPAWARRSGPNGARAPPPMVLNLEEPAQSSLEVLELELTRLGLDQLHALRDALQRRRA